MGCYRSAVSGVSGIRACMGCSKSNAKYCTAKSWNRRVKRKESLDQGKLEGRMSKLGRGQSWCHSWSPSHGRGLRKP